jgi:hypothetical protein
MYNIYDSIFTNTGEGVQDFKVFYDTLFLNTKISNNAEFLNIVIIEPLKYDFSSSSFSSGGEGTIINFGNTNHSEPVLSDGNTFINCILDDNNKLVFLVGLSSTSNYTIPVIYSYDLNNKEIIKEFPSDNDISEWESFTNFTYQSTQIPFIRMDKNLHIGFKTLSAGQCYLNLIELSLNRNNSFIYDYKLLQTPNLEFTGYNDKGIIYKTGSSYGIIDYK